MQQLSRTVALAGAAALAAMGLAFSLRRRSPAPGTEEPDERAGVPQDRGRSGAVGLDVAALRSASGHEPVVQFLSYIQSRRGGDGHLLFVRDSDLDAMAAREGLPVETFLERMDQLGVVVSTN